MEKIGTLFLRRPSWVVALVLAALLALPVALWLDLKTLSERNLERQAASLNSNITSVRSYYAQNVVGRVLSTDGQTQPLHNYHDVPGAIPIPATLSLELGDAFKATEGDITYRFVSDHPFQNRPPHNLSSFETRALESFRSKLTANPVIMETSGSLLDQRVTLATPVVMGGTCVACHNAHSESAKQDWEVGDVRGLQTISVHQPVALNLFSFKWLLGYLLVAGSAGLFFAWMQFRLAGRFSHMNQELSANNEFLAGISMKISKYLSPQVYRSIFSGEREVEISTERKKLTVFFSDIKDFTSTTEMLQPEELTNLLNEYFTEMSKIAEAHGATIDKFIGDAMVAFFGDPETRGPKADAQACLRMALDMQARLEELENEWRARGVEHPFKARMGINTGYCNVGNFGSDERMDYTIIGAEANLAARLESIAKPGGIVISYETYAHVKDIVEAKPLEEVSFKGVARKVIPFEVLSGRSDRATPFEETLDDNGQLLLRVDAKDERTRAAIRRALVQALGQS
jgi:class 3 adenylate cyclase